MKHLYKGAYILKSTENGFETLKNAYLGVENDTICYVGTEKPQEEYDSFTDLGNVTLMSGFFNAHNHAAMVLLRGVGSDLSLQDWLYNTVFPIEDRLTAEDIKAGSDLACLEMLAGGTVSFSDMYFEPHTTIQTVIDCGMKANIGRPIMSFDPNENPADNYRLVESMRLYNTYHNAANGRIKTDFSIHAEYTCPPRLAEYYVGLLKEHHGNLHIHLSETKREHEECIQKYGVTPAKWFEQLGAFDEGAFAAHCVWLSDDDIEILRRHGVSVVHNPTSNMKLGSGFADVQKYINAGVNVALGTDGAASNNNLNMVEEMHIAGIIHNGYTNDPTVMSAETVLKMATQNGAIAQQRPDTGRLAVGMKADIIAVNMDKPHLTPCFEVLPLVAYSMQSSDVVMTMVDGKILYRNGEYLTMDKEKVYFDVKKAIKRLYQ